MEALTLSEIPVAQFTAGAIAKARGIKIAEAHDLLTPLVDKGVITKKTAASGAVNYRLVKNAKAAKKAGTAKKAAPRKTASAGAAGTRAERVALASKERRALKEWEKGGGKGRRPKTPNLDSIEKGEKTASKAKGDKAPSTRGTTVRFMVNGAPMPDSQNKLSSVAWYHTKGVGGEDVVRISAADLRAMIVAEGVADPSNTAGWSFTLANGKVIDTIAL